MRTLDRNRSVRVALVGYGMGGRAFHAPFIAADPRLALTAVVTGDPHRRGEVFARYPDASVLGDVDALLARIDDVDLVVVSTPNATHVPVAGALLDRGRPVVVDKPVAPSAAAIEDLAGRAAARGTLVIPFHNRRWDGDLLTVARLLADGALGRVVRFESRWERWQPEPPTGPDRAWKRDPAPGSGGGILHDLGTHLVDQAVLLFGPPRSVHAEVAVRRAGGTVDDDVWMALEHPGGPSVHLWASAVAADAGPRFRVLGSEAAFVSSGMDVQEAALLAGATPGGPTWGRGDPGHLVIGAGRRAVQGEAGDYGRFYAGVAACLLDGAPPPLDVADAVIVARVIEAAARSAATGRVVDLTDPTCAS